MSCVTHAFVMREFGSSAMPPRGGAERDDLCATCNACSRQSLDEKVGGGELAMPAIESVLLSRNVAWLII
jgi:hypothetical protein